MASGVASGGAGQAASGATRLEARAVVRDDAVQLLDTACWRMGPARSRRALINWPHGPSAHCPHVDDVVAVILSRYGHVFPHIHARGFTRAVPHCRVAPFSLLQPHRCSRDLLGGQP